MRTTHRKSHISQSCRMDELKSMFSYSWKSFILMSLIIGVLLFFLNILIGIANHTNKFADTVTSTYGSMFFYIDEQAGKTIDDVYNQTRHLQEQLDAVNIANTFITKNQAKAYFAKKMPDIISKFDEYDIQNPFPPTLHIQIKDEHDYQLLQQILPGYKNIITNLEEGLKTGRDFKSQETRVVKAMNFSNFLVYGSCGLILIFIAIICLILFSLVRILLEHFYQKIEIKKLLGASYFQISAPFQAVSMAILLGGFIIMFLLVFILDLYLQSKHFSMMFFVDVFSLPIIPSNISQFILSARYVMIIEIVVIIVSIYFINHIFLSRKIKKIGN